MNLIARYAPRSTHVTVYDGARQSLAVVRVKTIRLGVALEHTDVAAQLRKLGWVPGEWAWSEVDQAFVAALAQVSLSRRPVKASRPYLGKCKPPVYRG